MSFWTVLKRFQRVLVSLFSLHRIKVGCYAFSVELIIFEPAVLSI